MASSNCDYKLRCTLRGHSMDVRGVTTTVTSEGQEVVVSGSRDKTCKVWVGPTFQLRQTLQGHTNFVSCVHAIAPSTKWPQGLILSGGNDHTVLGFHLGQPTPVFKLIGHTGTVCSMAGDDDSLIVTGSWDQSAKVWSNLKAVADLIGHQASVWAVAVSNSRIITGSADKQIRLWVDFKCVKVFEGHEDCVRALKVVDDDKFISASNDSAIRLWSISSGETIQTFFGHTNFIYSVAVFPDKSGFVSVGEDRSLRIWKNGDVEQVIHHPATSVWSVAILPNEDVVTASSDGTVRVFTKSLDRRASAEELASFDQEVSSAVIAGQQDLGGMKVSELPGPEALLSEGKREGETRMVREGDKVGCYSWSSSEGRWTKVGDVVGASGATQDTSGKVLYEGKEYDYVFTVDLDGQGTLKLPYNRDEDPWFAAQKFIHKNDLSQLFLDQVANFIVKNTKGQVSHTVQGDYADPFTGGNRYVPSNQQVSHGTNTVANQANSSFNTIFMTDSKGESQNLAPSFPVKDYVKFSAVPNYDNLSKKLKEFIKDLPNSEYWDSKVDIILSIGKVSAWNSECKELINRALDSWPLDKLFPIVDLLRLGMLDEAFAKSFNTDVNVIETFGSEKYLSQNYPVIQMLTLRLLSNSFGTLNDHLLSGITKIISSLLNAGVNGKQNEIAMSTLLLNFSVSMNTNAQPIETRTELLLAACQLLEMTEEPEGLFRLIVCIGTVAYGHEQLCKLVSNLISRDLLNKLQGSNTPKVSKCAEELQKIILGSTN